MKTQDKKRKVTPPKSISAAKKKVKPVDVQLKDPKQIETQQQKKTAHLKIKSVPNLENDKVLGTRRVKRNITEQKLAEEVIKDNEKRFRELIESLPQLFWTCRVDGPCDYLSKQWVEFTGIPEVEQLGYGWLEQLHPEDKDRTVSEWMEKVKTGESFDIEFRIRRYDGVYRWFKTRAVPMHDAEGNIIKWFGSNTDFQEIKKAEEQLRKLNRIYSLLSDINQAIVRTHVPQELYDKVCNIAVGQGGFGMAWIGLIDESSQKLKVIAQAGRTNGYHEQVNISLKGKPLRGMKQMSENQDHKQSFDREPVFHFQ